MEIASIATMNWVYDFSDYQQMFDLTPVDLSKSLFNFPAGISSFNAQATQQGLRVASGDPAYALSEAEMRVYAERVFQKNVARLKASPDCLKEATEATIQRVIEVWKKTEVSFLGDYVQGQSENRYQVSKLPRLSYQTHQFDLALCADFIFYHSSSTQEIAASVKELCRIAAEVRIFPLLDEQGKTSDELGPLMLFLQQNNFGVEVREVPYKTLRGSNAMLRIWSQACEV